MAYKIVAALPSDTLADLSSEGTINKNALDYLQKTAPDKYAEVQKLADDKMKINNINANNKRLFDKAN